MEREAFGEIFLFRLAPLTAFLEHYGQASVANDAAIPLGALRSPMLQVRRHLLSVWST